MIDFLIAASKPPTIYRWHVSLITGQGLTALTGLKLRGLGNQKDYGKRNRRIRVWELQVDIAGYHANLRSIIDMMDEVLTQPHLALFARAVWYFIPYGRSGRSPSVLVNLPFFIVLDASRHRSTRPTRAFNTSVERDLRLGIL
jgi:hypothetical protein